MNENERNSLTPIVKALRDSSHALRNWLEGHDLVPSIFDLAKGAPDNSALKQSLLKQLKSDTPFQPSDEFKNSFRNALEPNQIAFSKWSDEMLANKYFRELSIMLDALKQIELYVAQE